MPATMQQKFVCVRARARARVCVCVFILFCLNVVWILFFISSDFFWIQVLHPGPLSAQSEA